MQTKEKVLEVRDLSVGFVSHGKKVNVIRNVTMDVYQRNPRHRRPNPVRKISLYKNFTACSTPTDIFPALDIVPGEDLTKKTHEAVKGIRGKAHLNHLPRSMTSLNPLLTIGYQMPKSDAPMAWYGRG